MVLKYPINFQGETMGQSKVDTDLRSVYYILSLSLLVAICLLLISPKLTLVH